MTDEHERRVVLKITCERCHMSWHFRLRVDHLGQFHKAEPTVVCGCGATITFSPGEVWSVGRIPEASVAAAPHLRTEAIGLWECIGCGQRWHSYLEGEVQDIYIAESASPSYVCGCGTTLVLREWNFHDAPLAPQPQHPPRGSAIQFTETERLVLEQVVDGKSNAEIARQLSLSDGTVRNVVSSLYHKLGVKTRLQAANAAIIAGIAPAHTDVTREASTDR
jgi:DNA-binding CsgD family transcriptional regulator